MRNGEPADITRNSAPQLNDGDVPEPGEGGDRAITLGALAGHDFDGVPPCGTCAPEAEALAKGYVHWEFEPMARHGPNTIGKCSL